MVQFEAQVNYAGQPITVKSDDFAELHRAIARIEDLNRDARFLVEKGAAPKAVRPSFRMDQEGNAYHGVKDVTSGKDVTHGQYREDRIIPFFPKGEDGYYDPSEDTRSRPPRSSEPRSSDPTRPAPSEDAPTEDAPGGDPADFEDDGELPF